MERKDVAKLFHGTVGRAIAQVREFQIQTEFHNKKSGDYFLKRKPVYISQHAKMDKSSAKDFRGSIKDRKAAERFGARDEEEFSYWSWRACGIVALQMVLKTVLGDKFNKKTMDLIRDGLDFRGYQIPTDTGWYHSSLVEIAHKYGLKAEMKKFIPSIEVASLIDRDKYVLCSVKSDYGGHIMLAYGYRIGSDGRFAGLWVNDPGDYYHNGDNRFLSKEEFDGLFTRRVIVINE